MSDGTIAEIIAMLRDIQSKLDEHVEDATIWKNRIQDLTEKMARAFPNDDFDSHRLYHANRMRAALKGEAMMDAVMKRVVEWVVIAVVGFVAYGIWKHIVTYIMAGHA